MTKIIDFSSHHPNQKTSHLSTSQTESSSIKSNVTNLKVKPNHAKSYETLATILVNIILSVAAIASLIKLIPEQSVQASRLNDLNTEVAAREKTVNCLREQFSQSFDLGNSQTASLRDKGLIKSTQRPIRIINDPNTKALNFEPKGCG